MRFRLPYHTTTIPVEIDDRNLAGTLVSKAESYRPDKSEQDLVEASLDHPIGSSGLEELVRGKKNIVIISSDHTRPVPSKIITPILLRRIRGAQPDANIKILVATGFLPAGKFLLCGLHRARVVSNEEVCTAESAVQVREANAAFCQVWVSGKNRLKRAASFFVAREGALGIPKVRARRSALNIAYADKRPIHEGCFHASRVRLPSKAVRLAAATELICGCHTGGKPSEPVRHMPAKRIEAIGYVELTSQPGQILHGRQRELA